MGSHTTLMDKELPHLPAEGGNPNWSDALQAGQLSVGSAVVDEWQGMPASDQTAVCRTPALELFSQVCSTYIECELGSPAEWQCSAPMLSMSEFADGGSLKEQQMASAEAKSVDAALPSLLNEIEAFIAHLREEND